MLILSSSSFVWKRIRPTGGIGVGVLVGVGVFVGVGVWVGRVVGV